MSAIVIIAIILFVAGPTTVFFASKAPSLTLAVRTAVAALGFLLLAIALYLVGALA